MPLSRMFPFAFGTCRDGSCLNDGSADETTIENVPDGDVMTSEFYHDPGLLEIMCKPSRRAGGNGCYKDDIAEGSDGFHHGQSAAEGGLDRSPSDDAAGARYATEAEAPGLLEQVRQMFDSANCQPQRREPMSDFTVEPEETQLLQEAMMTFIRTLLRGVCIEVLLDDGSVLFPEASLNYELTHLILHVNENEAQRSIALKDVESVATPHDLEQRNIVTSIQPYLDERCCTLIIRDYEFVTFRFDTERLREYFASCLRLLITAPSGEPVPGLDAASELSQSKGDASSILPSKTTDAAGTVVSAGTADAAAAVVDGADAGSAQSGASPSGADNAGTALANAAVEPARGSPPPTTNEVPQESG